MNGRSMTLEKQAKEISHRQVLVWKVLPSYHERDKKPGIEEMIFELRDHLFACLLGSGGKASRASRL
jgi:hypothetical protein